VHVRIDTTPRGSEALLGRPLFDRIGRTPFVELRREPDGPFHGLEGLKHMALRAAGGTGAATVIAILPDGGGRYLADRFWSEA